MMKSVNAVPALVCMGCFLSACGGSGPNGTSTELLIGGKPVQDATIVPRAGFATATTAIGRGTVWTLKDIPQLSYEEGNLSRPLEDRDVTINITETSGLVTVTIDDVVYDLVFDQGRDSTFRFDDFLNDAVLRREYFPDPNVEYVYLAFTEFAPPFRMGIADGSAGFYTIGYQTDPTITNQISGSATYEGEIDVIVAGDGRVGFGEGTVELVADFTSGLVSGQATIENGFVANVPIPTDLYVPPTTINLEEAKLANGAFEGGLTVASGGNLPFGATFDSGTYEGEAYGPLADGLGGQITGTWKYSDGETAYTMQGAFVGVRDQNE